MRFDIWRSPALDELQVVQSNLHRFSSPAHGHRFMELVWLQSGTMMLRCRGQGQVLHPGSVFAIAPGEIHSNSLVNGEAVRYRVLQIPPEVLREVDRRHRGAFLALINRVPVHVFAADPARRLVPALTTALQHWHLGGRARAETEALLNRLFMSARVAGDAGSASAAAHPAVLRARAIIEQQLGERIELADLAEQVSLNERYLIGLFKRGCGMSPCQYQLSLRAERARILIVAEHALVDVALSTGFADQSHLIRHFRKFFGITPSFFRRACSVVAPTH